ncbi:MAG TPA: hypothetical protein VK633_00555 [Verrucomicrobiae bacterium]|nr:hypothetical protein [Verrucomicrobiae bacterium]
MIVETRHSKFSARNIGLLLGFFLSASFFRVLFAGETFCYRDFGVLAIPTAAYHRAAVWSGAFPLWNPYSNCGVPFLAQWGTMVLYPFSLIYVLLPLPWSLNFFCVAHLWIGGMGMYYLARKWMNEEWPAAFAAVAFVFNGITQASLTWPNYTAALGLLPWVILGVMRTWERTDRTRRNRSIFCASLLSVMQLLTGVPELCLFTWLVLTVFWIERLLSRDSDRRATLTSQLLVVALTAGLFAAQLLPFLELLAHSQRTPGFAAEKWALPPWGWANLLLPRFHTFRTYEGTAFQIGQEFLSSTYLGAPLLLLSATALRSRLRAVWNLSLISVFSAVLALGSSGYLYPFLAQVFPPLAIARYPVKFLFILSFTIPLLSAFGLQQLFALGPRLSSKWITRSALAATILIAILVWFNYAYPFPLDRLAEFKSNTVIRWFLLVLFVLVLFLMTQECYRMHLRALQFALLLTIVLDCMTHLEKQNPTTPSSVFVPDLWIQAQQFEKPSHGAGRVFITPEAEAKLLHSTIPSLQQDLTGKRLALWSHLNLLDQVPKVNGSATLQLRDQALLQNSLYSGTNSSAEAWLDFLNVTLKTSSNSVVDWQPRIAPMPFLTAGQKPRKLPPSALEPGIEFGREVTLEPWSADLDRIESSTVEISDLSVSSQAVQFTAKTDKPSVAVLPVTWHPSWQAQIQQGGAPATVPLLKANLAFQAVLLPAGESRVLLRYVDNYFRVGCGISILTLVLSGLFCRAKTKRPSQS